VILLAHAQVKRFQSPDQDSYDRFQPALHDSAAAMWQEWSDEVLFASYRVFVRKEDQGFNKERTIAVDGMSGMCGRRNQQRCWQRIGWGCLLRLSLIGWHIKRTSQCETSLAGRV
jgi:hypothetical protein